MSCCFSFFNWLLGKNDEPDPLEAIHIAEEPGMVIFRNVRTQKECQEIIALASPALEPSKVSGSLISPDRTSSSVFFQGDFLHHPAVIKLEDTMSALAVVASQAQRRALLVPREATQIIKYEEGEFFRIHCDNNKERDGSQADRSPLLRTATIILYLTTMGKGCGGETYFPFAAPSDVEMKRRAELSHLGVEMTSEGGLEVRPIRGQALLFWSVGREGREDPAAAHSAEPVVHGTKWIATRWYRELEWALPPAGH